MFDYNQTFFRNYDPAIGRFIAIDPMPESSSDLNVYQYAGNNPVMMNDPMGDLSTAPGTTINPRGTNGMQSMQEDEFEHDEAGAEMLGFQLQAAEQNATVDSFDQDFSSFWSSALSLTSDILDGITVGKVYFSGADFVAAANVENDVSNNPGEYAELDLNQNGSIGLFTSQNSASTDPSDGYSYSDLSGSYAQTLTVVVNHVDEIAYESKNNRYHNPGILMNVGVRVTGTLGTLGYNEVQTLSYDNVNWSIDNRGNSNNLYYNNKDINSLNTEQNQIYKDDGLYENALVTDNPGSSNPNFTLHFQTTLLVVLQNNLVSPLISVTWGYEESNGVANPIGNDPYIYNSQNTPNENQTYINKYNLSSPTQTPAIPWH